MIRPWPTTDAERLLVEARVFRLAARRARSPRTGEEHEFFILQTPDWVNVVPLTDEGEVILIEQYRQGLSEVTLEIPGGMVDPGDADPAAAAGRELEEETGYRAATIEPLGSTAPNPAIQNNRCHTFLARGLTESGQERRLDGSEDIEVRRLPLADIPGLIRTGRITHALVIVAFWHLRAAGFVF